MISIRQSAVVQVERRDGTWS